MTFQEGLDVLKVPKTRTTYVVSQCYSLPGHLLLYILRSFNRGCWAGPWDVLKPQNLLGSVAPLSGVRKVERQKHGFMANISSRRCSGLAIKLTMAWKGAISALNTQ